MRGQTTHDFELIIIDDASRDGTAEQVQGWLAETGFPARFIVNPFNRGVCANLNRTLALARGRLVCLLSGDDAYEPNRIAQQLRWFEDQPEDVAAVFSDARMVGDDGRDLHQSFVEFHLGAAPVPAGPELFRRLLLGGNFIPMPAAMLRRSAFEWFGPADESLAYEDYGLWLSLSRQFRVHYLDECLVRYRKLPESLSRSRARRGAIADSEFRILSSWLGRCGDANAALIDRLWARAWADIDQGLYAEARRAFPIAAAADGRWRRRIVAALMSLPPGARLLSLIRGSLGLARRAYTYFGRRLR